MLVTILDLKQETGLTAPAIRSAIAAAGVALHPPADGERGGRYDHDAAIAAIKGNVSFGHVAEHAASGRGVVTDASFNSLAGARSRVEMAKAERMELENDVRTGKLVDREAVTATGVELIVRVRTALLSVGTRAAAQVVGKSDHLAVAEIINATVREVLGELATHDQFNEHVLNG